MRSGVISRALVLVAALFVAAIARAEDKPALNGVALVMVSIMENPVGRAVVSCPGVVDEIETAPVVFRAIRATVTLPRLP